MTPLEELAKEVGWKITAAGVEMPPPILVTVPNVPICATGIEYPLSSGPATFIEEDLMDAVQSQDDPAIHSPRLKLGHIDPRFNGPEFDATPAFGKAVNMRLAENNQLLMSDWAGIPKWLADIMPIAYPNRSIEGNMEVETVTGHKWNLCIWRIALLGVQIPGVSVLEDLPMYYGNEMPPGVQVINPETGEEVDVAGAAIRANAGGRPVQAAIAVEDIRRAYYEQLDADQMWWWIRSMYLDPNELIVDDESGTLYRVPFDVKGEEVTFNDPVEVKIKFVDASAGRQSTERRAIALVASAGREVATWTERTASRPETNKEGSTVDKVIIQSLRAAHGLSETDLPDDANEEQIKAAITAGVGEGGAQPAPVTPPPAVPPAPEETEETEEKDEKDDKGVQAASVPKGMVVVPADQWAAVQAGAQAATKLAAKDEAEERDSKIAAACKVGKIRPADKQSMVNLHASNKEAFDRLLTAKVEEGGLAPGLYPVTEAGGNPPLPEESGIEGAGVAYDASWLAPAERQRIDAIKAGTHQTEQVIGDTPIKAH